jgi:hypothetical protein
MKDKIRQFVAFVGYIWLACAVDADQREALKRTAEFRAGEQERVVPTLDLVPTQVQ